MNATTDSIDVILCPGIVIMQTAEWPHLVCPSTDLLRYWGACMVVCSHTFTAARWPHGDTLQLFLCLPAGTVFISLAVQSMLMEVRYNLHKVRLIEVSNNGECKIRISGL